jgi:putative nucleotidyltransferase with HDIG domain
VGQLHALSVGTLTAFARAIDANSPWTAGHSERVTRVALILGRELQLPEEELRTLERGGLLHDVGKIAVPAAILDKREKLDPQEWHVVKQHPVVGFEILEPIPAFASALPIVRSHHERMDGTGYPDGLRGDAIPWLARVLAVADVFDALVSDRPYRPGLPVAEAARIITSSAGSHLDPRVVLAFQDAMRKGRIRAEEVSLESSSLAAEVARARVPHSLVA